MSRTRILHVYKDFAPRRGGGGVARHIAGLATASAEQGHELRVVASTADTDEGGQRYAVHQAGPWRLAGHVRWADIVHVHGARNPLALLAALLAHAQGKRLLYTPHCYYDDDRGRLKKLGKRLWDATAERWLLRRADASVLLAECWLDYLRRRGLGVSRPVLLPNCVLQAELHCRPPSPGGLGGIPAILSVGRLDAVKRLDDAIHALHRPGLERAELHLVGSGPDRERLQALVEAAGLAARVHFHGFVGDREVAAMAAAAHVFVLPSSTEGMPTVLIEMLLRGRPVVASDIPGNRAILAEVGLEDALYPLADVPALAARIVQRSATAITPAQQARTRAGFTWEGMGMRIRALYENAPDRHP